MRKDPEEQSWFSVRCVLRHEDGAYEERITVWCVRSFEAAIEAAEDEAREYGEQTESTYVGLAQAFALVEEELHHGAEVFSLVRRSDLEPEPYVDRFFDTGAELHDR